MSSHGFTSNLTYLWGSEFHNNAPLTPFLAVSAVFALKKINVSFRAARIFLLFFILTGGFLPGSILYKMMPLPDKNYTQFNYINESLKIIPATAAVSAQTTLAPHLSNREKIYLFPEILDAEFIIVDSRLNTYPLNKDELVNKISVLKKSDEWKLIHFDKSLFIFKKITAG